MPHRIRLCYEEEDLKGQRWRKGFERVDAQGEREGGEGDFENLNACRVFVYYSSNCKTGVESGRTLRSLKMLFGRFTGSRASS